MVYQFSQYFPLEKKFDMNYNPLYLINGAATLSEAFKNSNRQPGTKVPIMHGAWRIVSTGDEVYRQV